MFCPKCGTKNPEDGKFCRSCGSDVAVVRAAMTGRLPAKMGDFGVDISCDPKDALRRKDPHEVYGDGIKGMITGIGFLVVSLSLFFTGVANGRVWWWALLFPAFFGFAKGVADLMKSRKMLESRRAAFVPQTVNPLGSAPDRASLPTAREFIPPPTRYQTDDLVPPSVTDNTTRHLEINVEGETMALPKK
ncbi:MAG: zinc-ribbon domain-containing protein [bacterium]|nr:zinc-ribbon domain-containing protein [bacterium]